MENIVIETISTLRGGALKTVRFIGWEKGVYDPVEIAASC